MRGKLIVVEGTDCSGKETQTNKLVEKLTNDGRTVKRYSFPMYETPTGKIVGGPYLGKSYICEGWFPEGAPNVNNKVASLYYAADRLYNIDIINNDLENGIDVILDRYVYSNMAHQGAKLDIKRNRIELYKWLEELEFNLLGLPVPDIRIFLHMPTEYSKILKQGREEAPDQHEQDENHLMCAERAYLEIAEYYDFTTIECVNNNEIRTIDNINNELYQVVNKNISSKTK
ncbi:MAG: thymidylate kinase [Lactobacillales bacterium]|nr:thymidylate kinase [Lactobacillales bacterium]